MVGRLGAVTCLHMQSVAFAAQSQKNLSGAMSLELGLLTRQPSNMPMRTYVWRLNSRYMGTKIWNQICVKINLETTASNFKILLKKFLVSNEVSIVI